MGFEIPPAKRPEPEEGSVTESESDFDMQLPSRPPTSALPSVPVTGNAVVHGDVSGAHLSSSQERSVGARP